MIRFDKSSHSTVGRLQPTAVVPGGHTGSRPCLLGFVPVAGHHSFRKDRIVIVTMPMTKIRTAKIQNLG